MGKYFGTDGFRGEAGITLTADQLKDGMMLRKMRLLFRSKKMNLRTNVNRK